MREKVFIVGCFKLGVFCREQNYSKWLLQYRHLTVTPTNTYAYPSAVTIISEPVGKESSIIKTKKPPDNPGASLLKNNPV